MRRFVIGVPAKSPPNKYCRWYVLQWIDLNIVSCVSYFPVISLFVAHQLCAERSQQQMLCIHASLGYAPISQRQVSRDVSCGAIGVEGDCGSFRYKCLRIASSSFLCCFQNGA